MTSTTHYYRTFNGLLLKIAEKTFCPLEFDGVYKEAESLS